MPTPQNLPTYDPFELPSVQPHKKNRTLNLLSLIAILLACVAAAGLWLYWDRSTPSENLAVSQPPSSAEASPQQNIHEDWLKVAGDSEYQHVTGNNYYRCGHDERWEIYVHANFGSCGFAKVVAAELQKHVPLSEPTHNIGEVDLSVLDAFSNEYVDLTCRPMEVSTSFTCEGKTKMAMHFIFDGLPQ